MAGGNGGAAQWVPSCATPAVRRPRTVTWNSGGARTHAQNRAEKAEISRISRDEGQSEQALQKRYKETDVKLPQQRMREITVWAHQHNGPPASVTFWGKWLAGHLDRDTGDRHSIAQRDDGAFVVVVKRDDDPAVCLRVLADIEAVRNSDLELKLKRAAGAHLGSAPGGCSDVAAGNTL